MLRPFAILTLGLAISSPALLACGLDLSAPRTHFENIDEQGHVMFVDSLGSLALKDGTSLPLYIMFKSNWSTSSPILGQGWMLPLLESRIVQIDENTFQMWMPNGRYQYLGRDKANPNILNGQAGWKAEVAGDTINAWAACGWKLSYERGKIASITTPGNDTLQMIYRTGQLTELQENGVPIVSVEVDPNTGIANGLMVNGRKIALQESNRPTVQVLDGRNVIGQVSPSLSQATLADGTTRSYQFKVDEKTNPVLIANGHTIQWDPKSLLITRADGWNYIITSKDPTDAALIERSGAGNYEAYRNDPRQGTEMTCENGSKQIRQYFTYGPLAGLLRKITETDNGATQTIYAEDYDDKCRPIRIIDLKGTRTFAYDDTHHRVDCYKDSKWSASTITDSAGRVISITTSSGYKQLTTYTSAGIAQTETTLPASPLSSWLGVTSANPPKP